MSNLFFSVFSFSLATVVFKFQRSPSLSNIIRSLSAYVTRTNNVFKWCFLWGLIFKLQYRTTLRIYFKYRNRDCRFSSLYGFSSYFGNSWKSDLLESSVRVWLLANDACHSSDQRIVLYGRARVRCVIFRPLHARSQWDNGMLAWNNFDSLEWFLNAH